MLEQHRDNIEEKLVQLAAEMNVEIMRFEKSEFRFALDNYLVGTRIRKRNFLEGLITVDQKIDGLKAEIRSEYGEMKKLEIALQNRIEEAKLLAEEAENKITDDIYIARAKKQSA